MTTIVMAICIGALSFALGYCGLRWYHNRGKYVMEEATLKEIRDSKDAQIAVLCQRISEQTDDIRRLRLENKVLRDDLLRGEPGPISKEELAMRVKNLGFPISDTEDALADDSVTAVEPSGKKSVKVSDNEEVIEVIG